MPWRGVTLSEQRQRFLEDYQLNYYSVSELAERFSILRKTAYPGLAARAGKWIDRFEEHGQNGFHKQSRRPHGCPWQTDPAIVQELVELRKAHPHWWGPRKLLDLMYRRHRKWELPAVSTAARILARQGLVRSRRRYRRAHPGCPKSIPPGPNDIWAADYKGQFRLKDGRYCFPLTVSDLASWDVLGCDAPPAISLDRTLEHFKGLFETYGLPHRIRTLRPSKPKRLEPYDYPSHYLVRRVSRCGTIRVLRNQVFVSNTLNEDTVGLEEVDDGVYDLFYCFYHVGRYELKSNKIHDIVSKVRVSRRQVDLASRVSPMSFE